MKKKEARAWLAFQKAINKACDTLEARIEKAAGPAQLDWTKLYASVHCRTIANGCGYGTAPIGRAMEVLEDV